jgi:hypothetical protein
MPFIFVNLTKERKKKFQRIGNVNIAVWTTPDHWRAPPNILEIVRGIMQNIVKSAEKGGEVLTSVVKNIVNYAMYFTRRKEKKFKMTVGVGEECTLVILPPLPCKKRCTDSPFGTRRR